MPKGFMNKLYFGDNLDILRDKIADASVDLVYLDPPFNSKADYNVLFKTQAGDASAAQATAFKDTWEWDDAAAKAYHELMTDARVPDDLRRLMEALKVFLTGSTGNQGNSMMAYLTMMALRMVELHRVLKPTGSLYLHCDPTASHYLKLILDATFGFENFVNEISWKRTTTKNDYKQGAQNWPRIRDVLLHFHKDHRCKSTFHQPFAPYGQSYVDVKYRYKDDDGRIYRLDNLAAPGAGTRGHPQFEFLGVTRYWRYNKPKMQALYEQGRIVQTRPGTVPQYKRYLDEVAGIAIGDSWEDVAPINAMAQERLGYPTQKPEALLARIIEASSNEGDVVLDPCCGCGTTIAVAERLKRNWIGIDVTYLAVDLMERRLLDMFCPGHDILRLADVPAQKRRHALRTYWKSGADELLIGLQPGLAPFEVEGDPKDLSSARFLFENDPFQFEWWCVAMVGAQGREKKGADKGIDGIISFVDKPGDYKRALVSVKGGKNIKREMIATLKGDMEREGAVSGIMVTLEEPTGPMKTEAADAGRWDSEFQPRSFPKIQILTVAEILKGHAPDLPTWGLEVFRKAKRSKAAAPTQLALSDSDD